MLRRAAALAVPFAGAALYFKQQPQQLPSTLAAWVSRALCCAAARRRCDRSADADADRRCRSRPPTPSASAHDTTPPPSPPNKTPTQASAAAGPAVAQADAPRSDRQPSGLDPKGWVSLPLMAREQVTHNVVRLEFGPLPAGPDAPADLPVASCLLVKAPIGSDDGKGGKKAVLRPYTPTTPPGTKGTLELVIKTYEKGVMSKHLASLAPGKDALDFKGPIPKVAYAANERAHVGMIAGGTGVTPMLQVSSD